MTLHNRVKKFGAEVAQGFDVIKSWFPSSTAQGGPQVATLSAGSENTVRRLGSEDANTSIFASWFRASEESGTATTTASEEAKPSSLKKKTSASAHAWSSLDHTLDGILINVESRVDYVLQESTLEVANAYMSALFAHSGYFDNKDFLL